MSTKETGSFGKGAYGVLVRWKQRSAGGKIMETLYRYETEAERNQKLKSFKSNSKVQQAYSVSGYYSP